MVEEIPILRTCVSNIAAGRAASAAAVLICIAGEIYLKFLQRAALWLCRMCCAVHCLLIFWYFYSGSCTGIFRQILTCLSCMLLGGLARSAKHVNMNLSLLFALLSFLLLNIRLRRTNAFRLYMNLLSIYFADVH